MSRKESVLAIERDRPNEVLDCIAVHLDAAIGQEGLEPVPMGADIGQFLAEAGLCADARTLLCQPGAEGIHERSAAGRTGDEPRLYRLAADLGLDGVELCDPVYRPTEFLLML